MFQNEATPSKSAECQLLAKIKELTTQEVPDDKISHFGHLVAVEELLDELAYKPAMADEYAALETRARAFIYEHPELLKAPWVRNAGAVYDLLHEARESLLRSQEPAAAQASF